MAHRVTHYIPFNNLFQTPVPPERPRSSCSQMEEMGFERR